MSFTPQLSAVLLVSMEEYVLLRTLVDAQVIGWDAHAAMVRIVATGKVKLGCQIHFIFLVVNSKC